MWWSRGPSYFWGGVLVVVGLLALLGNLQILNEVNWNYVWPVLLIALGAWLLVARVLPGSSQSFGGAATSDRSDLREGLARAKLQLNLGSARLDIRGAALGDQLYHAKIGHDSHMPEIVLDRISGTLRISQTAAWMMGGWGRADIDLQLSDAVPWEIAIRCGSVKGTVDVSTVPLSGFECDSGSSRLELSVSKPAGEVPIRVEGGSVRLTWRRPVGTAARVVAAGASIRLTADGVRQGGYGNVTWQTPGYESATDRYAARFSGGSVNAELDQV